MRMAKHFLKAKEYVAGGDDEPQGHLEPEEHEAPELPRHRIMNQDEIDTWEVMTNAEKNSAQAPVSKLHRNLTLGYDRY